MNKEMKKINIIKNRSDIGAGTRGADMGIDAIEIAAINAESSYFSQYDSVDLESFNEAVYKKQNTTYALRIGKVLAVCEGLSKAVTSSLKNNEFPLVLSGDHSSALGTISGVKCAFPEKRVGVVWIDAHADIHSPHTTPSGNIHGMPLAAALSDDNLDRKINEVTDETNTNWEAMTNIGGIADKYNLNGYQYFIGSKEMITKLLKHIRIDSCDWQSNVKRTIEDMKENRIIRVCV